jgi:hypothetical protein
VTNYRRKQPLPNQVRVMPVGRQLGSLRRRTLMANTGEPEYFASGRDGKIPLGNGENFNDLADGLTAAAAMTGQAGAGSTPE